MMHHDYWGLSESPFRGDLELRYFYQSLNAEEVLARLHFLPDERRRLGLLFGANGVGKSQSLQIFARQLRHDGRQVAMIQAVGIGPTEFLLLLATELGLCPAVSATSAALWRMLDDQLRANRYLGLSTVVLIDDADEADPRVLAQIARLVQSDPTAGSRLTIVLAGSDQRVGHLGHRLLELAELRIDLDPWQAADTAGYLQTVMAMAGKRTDIFRAAAVTRIHELSAGVPRRVKQLADLSLVAGAGLQLPGIDADTVESVFFELGVVHAGPEIELASPLPPSSPGAAYGDSHVDARQEAAV